MKSAELIRKLNKSYLLRCKFWTTCGMKDCLHYEPHREKSMSCISFHPVKYCKAARGFVHDVPLRETNPDYECDPNLSFKAKRDAESRHRKKMSSFATTHADDSDDYWETEDDVPF